MQKWEYAELVWYDSVTSEDEEDEEDDDEVSGTLSFSHREEAEEFGEGAFWDTMRRLGDEGWELVSTHAHRTRLESGPSIDRGITIKTRTETVYLFKRPRLAE